MNYTSASAVEGRGTDKEGADSLSEQVHASLRAMILTGEIQPGEVLVELQLTRVFNVSRTPVRQALQRLRKEGLITRRGRRGFVVGAAYAGEKAAYARLEEVSIDQSRQWERIYASVEQAVLTEILHRTVRINELRLAEHFNVSRTVTRDVLARMHGVGLIDKTRSGAWVAERMTPDRVRHLYELRVLLEPAALEHAAAQLDSAQLRQAQARIHRLLQDSSVDSASFDLVEQDLHVGIVGACPNREIVKALERTHILFAPTRHLFDPVLSIPLAQIAEALHEHLEILDLLAHNKAPAAAARLADHLTGAVDRWLGRFVKNPLPDDGVEPPPYLTALDIMY